MKSSVEIAEDAAWRRVDIMDTARAISALVAAAIVEEREACAKIVEASDCERQFIQPAIDAIRARGNT